MLLRAQMDMQLLTSVVDQYRRDVGAYPTMQQGLEILTEPSPKPSRQGEAYLEVVPHDPWEQRYWYFVATNTGRAKFRIMSAGPDRELGTEDDISYGTGVRELRAQPNDDAGHPAAH
jgi:general secretion pathway protein G